MAEQHDVRIHPEHGPSCEYEMVRLALRNSKMVVIVQCKEHGTTFAVNGPAAGRQNEQGQLLIDEFDYSDGRDLAAQGFDQIQRKPDNDNFDFNFADHIRDDMAAIVARLKADGFPGLRVEDGGKVANLPNPVQVLKELGADVMAQTIADESAALSQLVTRVTAVITADHPRGSLNLNIDGEDRGSIPLVALAIDEHGVAQNIGSSVIDRLASVSLEKAGIDPQASIEKLRNALTLKKLNQMLGGKLADEQDWPEEQN
jgi:hypothetical protein